MSSSRFNLTRQHLRRAVQLVLLAAFAYMVVRPPSWELEWVSGQLWSRLDPLVGLTIVVAARALVFYAAAALITVVATLLLGRAWCGWVCPLGALVDLIPGRGRKKAGLPRWWRYGKYAVLAVVLLAAALGTLWPMFLDPITIVSRPLQEIAMRAAGTDALGQSVGATLSRGAIGMLGLLSLAPLAIVLGLNAVAKRFWCESVCPLGGLLGVLSFSPGLRRRVDPETCISCGKCAKACPTQAIDPQSGYRSSPGECVTCLSCIDACPTNANAFAWREPAVRDQTPLAGLDRREALGVLGVTGVSAAITFALPFAHGGEEVLRPPGTTEERLAQQCVRCGACYSACPTGVLRPSTSLTSEAGLWTPMLDARPAHCTLDCNKCAEVCPTDALHVPTEAEALELGLGAVAQVDRSACVAWSRGHECMDCQGVCPIIGAIYSTREWVVGPFDAGYVSVPHVDPQLCVACGQCTLVCPAHTPAIRVQR